MSVINFTSVIDISQENDNLACMTDDQHDISSLTDQAIEAALSCRWKEAISINSAILKLDKKNINALNRLGFAYQQSGLIKEAKQTFNRVLTLDQYNAVATKNLDKLANVKQSRSSRLNSQSFHPPMMFIEDPGKTKIVSCVHAAPVNTLSSIQCGEEVFLKAKNHCVEIRDARDDYLAQLPDDVSFRLIKLLAAKNTYRVYIKNVDKKSVTVFIKEISRGKKYANQPSFITNSSYQTIVRKTISDIEADKPDVTPTGEEEADSLEE
ncbi:hypothetical protein A2154_00875 [Candidatus Gottesmanbacteria bacterium RBG_16_43_7]|uniref:Uncharacterized protein n=1 Tax=Candidatus Gottesmanbacteria bacterium RBG_16_43_7 TaxID=1798373 RepID=A0A1F5Z8S8_9BACT|nr:MAG: hypothetical protein A2154_00875 [Candidatus Gottesmanbacteria bacterium RBG_16_43_7]